MCKAVWAAAPGLPVDPAMSSGVGWVQFTEAQALTSEAQFVNNRQYGGCDGWPS